MLVDALAFANITLTTGPLLKHLNANLPQSSWYPFPDQEWMERLGWPAGLITAQTYWQQRDLNSNHEIARQSRHHYATEPATEKCYSIAEYGLTKYNEPCFVAGLQDCLASQRQYGKGVAVDVNATTVIRYRQRSGGPQVDHLARGPLAAVDLLRQRTSCRS